MAKIKLQKLKNPWKILNSREVYRNSWMGIKEFNVLRPDGNKGIYAYMDCVPAVGIIPFEEEGWTYLVGQYRFPLKKYSWEIPTGMAEKGEDLVQTAGRELQEETGIMAGEIIKLGSFDTSNSLTNEVATLFLGLDCREGKQKFDPTEDLQIMRLKFKDVMDLVKKGEITDAMSLIGLSWAEAKLTDLGML